MKLTFLGGAQEIGASGVLVELAGRRILVDCGVRVGADDPLPMLQLLQEAPPDAVVLTHAHADHMGALPVLMSLFPQVPVYLTTATLHIARLMMVDALRLMVRRWEMGGPTPLYGNSGIEAFANAAHPLPLNVPLSLFDGAVRLRLFPAGHILGAVSAYFESPEGRVLVTGDLCVDDQLTIPGLMLPPVRPDVLVMEATYGDRLHARRQDEHQRLVEQTSEVLEQGGSVLFPAFAIGRAQEIILLLSRAMEAGRMPEAPIFVDGLVRSISRSFARHPELCSPWLRQRIERHKDPFFFKDSPAIPVVNGRMREDAIHTPQAIYVASSGSLSGGPSLLYARHLAQGADNLIAITGYQDEESPGRRLQELASQGRGVLKTDEAQVRMNCQVATYGLSAHADSAQLLGIVEALDPDHIALVHGNHRARVALGESIVRAGLGSVCLPVAGQTLEIGAKPGAALVHKGRPVFTVSDEDGEEDDEFGEVPVGLPFRVEALVAFARGLIQRDGPGATYTVQELLWALGEHDAPMDGRKVETFGQILRRRGSPFERDPKRPFIYRVRFAATDALRAAANKARRRRFNTLNDERTHVIAIIEALFDKSSGLYKRQFSPEGRGVTLAFHFPKVAARVHAEALERLREQTGWEVSLRSDPHQAMLSEAALEAVGGAFEVQGNPSVRLASQEVVVKVPAGEAEPEEAVVDEAKARFAQRTGFGLVVRALGQPAPVRVKPDVVVSSAAQDSRMEINRAFARIREAFVRHPGVLLKVSLKGEHIQLAFLTPEVGGHFAPMLEGLSEATGWPLEMRAHADQHRLKALARGLMPEGSEVVGKPSCFEDRAALRLKLAEAPDDAQLQEAAEAFFNATGWALEVVVS